MFRPETEWFPIGETTVTEIPENNKWCTQSIVIPVGRHTDYRIATEVLKLSVAMKLVYTSGEEQFYTDALPYSTDIFSAMQILQVLQNKRFMWSLNGSSEGGFWCVLYPPVGAFVETDLCDTPEQSICTAALLLSPELL
jgi:hypothetical protein